MEKIEQKIIRETFKNKEFADAVAQAIGQNIVEAKREIDDWNLSYEMKNLMSEALFTDEFRDEIKSYATAYIEENKDDIKLLVKDKVSSVITNGITEAAAKIGELLVGKIKDISKIY